MKAASVKIGRDDGSFSNISLTECQEALSERQFENKIWSAYFGSEVREQSVGIDPSFRIRLCENPALKWPSFVWQSSVKWLAWLCIDFFSVHFLRKWNLSTVSLAAQMEGVYGAPMFIGASQNCLACQWTTALCSNCRSIWKQVMAIYC